MQGRHENSRRYGRRLAASCLGAGLFALLSLGAGPRVAESAAQSAAPAAAADILEVASAEELRAAIAAALPGHTIQIAPGIYDFTGPSLRITAAGREDGRITLRAAVSGTVLLRFDLLEGFHVTVPYWTFENLDIQGTCADDTRCEHAFHVSGAAAHTVIRNNRVSDFNAAVKVNGQDGIYPDAGLIEGSSFTNSRPRATDKPVTPIDIVSVSEWRVRRNVIADFAKAGGNNVSYGAFFKGGGEGNIFEENIVRCEWQHRGYTRVGFSFGGGGTALRFCRNGPCPPEHRYGIARNNVIVDCPNDAGIYLNESANTLIHGNVLMNTLGIDVRFPTSTATITGNVLDGRIVAREGGSYTESDNTTIPRQP
ncbi:right-handed parallel beta-helix repeat-containing protein [Pelagibius sp. 7325]|uniref:right-handed parallel beta-helix repeat-containing protein n=1 Tax=Pelagibius sp. 7325 TaxID=3131994 RepID=UPI0030EC0C48